MSVTDTMATIRVLAGGDENITFSHPDDGSLMLVVKDQSLVRLAEIDNLVDVRACELEDGVLTVCLTSNQEENMASTYHDLAGAILDAVGGADNVRGLTHCITRLRFTLADESIAKTDEIKALDGVITVMQAGGQYQVVVGDKVDDVYDALLQDFGIVGGGGVPEDDAVEDEQGGNLFTKLMNVISGVMAPALMGLAAAGMVKGLISLAVSLGWMQATDGAYMVWYAIGDGFFYFLPIILGYTAAKKFGCSEFVGMAIGAALVYPSMVNLSATNEVIGSLFAGTVFQMDYYNTFFGIPIVLPTAGYTMSVIPIILAVWINSKLEQFLKDRIPSVLRGFLVPSICVAVMGPLTYLLIGPAAGLISGVLTWIAQTIYAIPTVGAALSGLVVGGAWSTLVMFGLHWAIVPVFMNNFATLGFDYVSAVTLIGGFIALGQGAAFLIKSRNQKMKDIAVPAVISQALGVGEPFLYGIQIPSKILFVQNIVLSAIGGLALGLAGVKVYGPGGMGFFIFPFYIDPANPSDLSNMIICFAITMVMMVAGFVLTFLTYSDKKAGFEVKENAA